MAVQAMQQNPMMSHLVGALDRGEDIGHYGRLVFTMVARHFLEEDELVRHLAKNPGFDEVQARALVKQVHVHDYDPEHGGAGDAREAGGDARGRAIMPIVDAG